MFFPSAGEHSNPRAENQGKDRPEYKIYICEDIVPWQRERKAARDSVQNTDLVPNHKAFGVSLTREISNSQPNEAG